MTRQTPDEIRRHLAEQIEFLKTSAELYDRGQHSEAKRLAVSVRTLLHDTDSSQSILKQLGLKGTQFLDTAHEPPKSIRTSYTGLIGTAIGTGLPTYVPNLDGVPSRFLQFETWWNAPIIVDTRQRQISRQRLVLSVCNKDGGAHVDPELDDIYADLSRKNSLERLRGARGVWEPMPGPGHASLRQIAHEVLKTLEPGYHPPSAKKPPPHFVFGGFELIGTPVGPKIGRNDPCPCKSGKKFKKCCGAK